MVGLIYGISEGFKLQVSNYQIDIVRHCNLSCRACGHFSPYAPHRFLTISNIDEDLTRLAQWSHANILYLMGGEPLLHPDILEIIQHAKDSHLADKVVVVTNGLLLDKMPQAFWGELDELVLSQYPETTKFLSSNLYHYQVLATIHQTGFQIWYHRSFREVLARESTEDSVIVERIYATCQNAHVGRCVTIKDGRIYRCPQAAFMSNVLLSKLFSSPSSDYVLIGTTRHFAEELQAYLMSFRPLSACRFCLGSVGRCLPHQQVRKESLNRSIESVLDYKFLSRLEVDPGASAGYTGDCE